MWTQAVEPDFKVYLRNPDASTAALLRSETEVECDLPDLMVGRITQSTSRRRLRAGLTAPIPPNVDGMMVLWADYSAAPAPASAVQRSVEATSQDADERPGWVCASGEVYLDAKHPRFPEARVFFHRIGDAVHKTAHVHRFRITPHSLFAACASGMRTAEMVGGLERYSKMACNTAIRHMVEAHTRSQSRVVWPYGTVEGVPLQLETNLHDLKRKAFARGCPMVVEWAWRNDPGQRLPMRLTSELRPYQAESVRRVYGGDRAKSGVIVLPCGAGKTLTGIAIAAKAERSCIVLCSCAVAVEQWIEEFRRWTTIAPGSICRFAPDSKDILDPHRATLLVTTYMMMAVNDDRRNARGRAMMSTIRRIQWGVMLLDEVHVAPASTFRATVATVTCCCTIGLTATLVREDNLIEELNELIGPKLYEGDWMELTSAGYLAEVTCTEVWCPMSPLFQEAYRARPSQRTLLQVLNPTKLVACEQLVRYHLRRQSKILICVDHVEALKLISAAPHNAALPSLASAATIDGRMGHTLMLDIRGSAQGDCGWYGMHYMYGETPSGERHDLLRRFRGDVREGETEINVLAISRVGDVAIDLPQANVLIQLASHFGSRRQETQRLGRLLRPHQGQRSLFYSLVSEGTAEMEHSARRQRYLVDQGYVFTAVRYDDRQQGAGAFGSVRHVCTTERCSKPYVAHVPLDHQRRRLASLTEIMERPACQTQRRLPKRRLAKNDVMRQWQKRRKG